MDWLLTAPSEREIKSRDDLAASLGVSKWTLKDWQYRNEEFIAEWRKRAMAVAGGPEKTEKLLKRLEDQWDNPESTKQLQAAQLWANIVGAIAPKAKEQVVKKSDLRELTTEVLQEMAAAAAQDELKARRNAS